MKRWISLMLILCLAAIRPMPARSISTSASSAILIDAATGKVLYEQNADAQQGIASTTKIMTGLLTAERCDLDEVIEVPAGAAGVEGSSLYLKSGQRISVRELLYGLMLKSGNDAAAALAIHMAGSIKDFAGLMNKRAAQLHMTGSRFANPHGLTAENHYSTARDMALLTREALRNPEFSKAVSTKYYEVAGITIKNHNKMLWNYDGADGVKTGYTQRAGRCLVSSATRDGMRLIAVTLRDGDDWGDHTALFDYGFDQYVLREIHQAGNTLAECPVYNGKAGTVTVRALENISLLVPKDRTDGLQTQVILPKYFWAPVEQGNVLGLIRVTLDGDLLYEGPLTAGETVAAREGEQSFWQRWLVAM